MKRVEFLFDVTYSNQKIVSIENDARRMSVLFDYGIINGEEVVAWADSIIVKMDLLPDPLLALSLAAPEKTGDIISHLHQLSCNADFWKALRSAIPQIRDFVIAHPDRGMALT
ncbi:MAG TPA: hypothetical protein VMF08_03140 [Candidatus Sulfotelmatobacter sp.]|nr:hypothetical protein [Candidatus Sulfotelmatobacter sp.]